MVPWTGSPPRRARHLIPPGLPRRGEVLTVCAMAILIAHLLLAQLTFLLAVAFAVVSRVSRWRLWWLLAPAAAGLAWTLAIGPGTALAGFTAGPSGILWHLDGGRPAGETGYPFAGFAAAQNWLPRQFPVALICGAAEAGLVGLLDWLHTDEWAVPPPRPGLLTAARRGLATRAVRAGAVLTRDGCALGIMPASGAVAELRWDELTYGALIVAASARDVTLTGLQFVHAALRRRKPVIVLDFGDAAVGRAVAAACRATGAPLLATGAAEPADPPALDLGHIVRERLAALLPANSAGLTNRACSDLSSLAARLRRIGVDGDALVWVPRGERVHPQALAALLRDSPDAGLSVLIGTTSPQSAAELCGLTGTTLSYRVTDRDLTVHLAARTGTRLLPAPVAAALAGQHPAGSQGPAASQYPAADPWPAAPASAGRARSVVAPTVGPVQDLVPSPVVPARSLLALGPAEFVLAVSVPRQRLIATGRLVPARLVPARLVPARLPGVRR